MRAVQHFICKNLIIFGIIGLFSLISLQPVKGGEGNRIKIQQLSDKMITLNQMITEFNIHIHLMDPSEQESSFYQLAAHFEDIFEFFSSIHYDDIYEFEETKTNIWQLARRLTRTFKALPGKTENDVQELSEFFSNLAFD